MADDRPLETAEQAIGRIDTKIADLESTLLARLARRPTGDVEPTIRSTPKPDTLILNGALVSRTTYAGLWSWAQGAGLVIAGMFTVGNGSTTFGLPDMRGRVPIGVGTLGSDTYSLGALGGASTRAISTANLPPHDHNVSINSDTHSHGGSTGGVGDHSGHNSGSAGVPAGSGLLIPANSQNDRGAHSHSLDINDDTHSHTVSESSVGSGTAFDVRQAYIAINWLIWT